MKIKTIIASCFMSAACLSVFSALNAQDIILDTNFTSNSNNPPSNIQWHSSSGGNFTAPGAHEYMRLTPTNNNRDVVAYFPEVTLGIGETLTLSYSVSILDASNTGSGFRIGLFNSNDSTKVTGNNFGEVFSDYDGYLLKANPRSSSLTGTALAVHGSSYLIAGSAGNYPNIYSSQGAEFGNANAILTGMISVTNNGDAGVSISYQVPGRTATETYTDTVHEYISFDTIGFSMQSNAGTSVTFYDMSLAVIPESKQFPVLLGAAALSCVFFARRR